MKFIYKLLLVIILVSCVKETKEEKVDCFSDKTIPKLYTLKKDNENLNISLLLDLSDRINPKKFPGGAMEYYVRDSEYIKSIAEAFNIHLRTKKIIKINDKIQLFFDPEPENKEIIEISNHLKFEIDKTTITNKLLCRIDSVYSTLPIKIYESAINDNEYIGSDTWGFFKNRVEDYCIEEGYRNVLIILTDGYIYHENNLREENNLTSYLIPQYIRSKKLNTKNWENKIKDNSFGYIPANHNLSNLEILILGIHPDTNNPYEEDIIRRYWSTWLTAMNVQRFEIKTADLPSNMDKLIKNFILLKK
ncbi:hypothetical protein ATO12_02980 [Aquimarina atlantica]|uniref:VWFA domain-containing protein n=1 Tax=Aquimarina atlantica TaxID=1317122 RepID=A0A023C0I0_9FLAO|nr:hypothetical protein [Aquimarina atlantica]EZH75765.1 hypothetical protein ATO12_02980 [Aquimarina atlantica]